MNKLAEIFLLQTTPNEFELGAEIFLVRPSIHTYPSGKQNLLETLFRLEEIVNAGFAF